MKRKTKRNQAIKELRTKGYTLQEIAEWFNVTKQRVHQILVDLKIDQKVDDQD